MGMNTQTQEALKLALEALEVATTPLAKDRQEVLRAITAIREALADHIGDANKMVEQSTCKQALQVEQPAQQQEPFCYHDGRDIVGKEYADHSDVFPLYTAPKPRQWVGLTQQDMKLALKTLEKMGRVMKQSPDTEKAIVAIRKALAEQPAQQQEPVAWMWKDGTVTTDPDRADGTWTPLYTSPPASKPWVGLTPKEKKEIERLSVYVEGAIRHTEAKLKEKNAQPSKPWVGLTQQDIDIAFDDTQEGGGFDEFARAIEAKLREKNTPQQSKGDA